MGNNAAILTLGILQVTPYGLCLGAGMALAAALVILLGRRKHGTEALLNMCLWILPLAVVMGHLVYGLARIHLLSADYQHGPALLLMPWMGGYTMFGALLGGLLGVFLCDRKHFASLADAAAPGAALMLCVGRMAEYFTGEGLGAYLEGETVFPLGLCVYADEFWSEWRVPVFAWEAFAALVILLIAVRLLKQGAEDGRTAEMTLGLICLTQIFLESLREDEFIRFGFVRFNQLAAAVMLLSLLILRIRRTQGKGALPRLLIFAAGIGGVVAVEFALDKSSIHNSLLYAGMVVLLILMGLAVLWKSRREEAV